jgi:predicted metal-dependent enzyme (double-stranded beta helix superfamily)
VNVNPTIDAALLKLRQTAVGQDDVIGAVLSDFLSGDKPVFGEICSIARPDTSNPYGRRVLLETDDLEMMVACWTPGQPCAPHDHGGSVGAVRVLQGRARHTMWELQDGKLIPAQIETVESGSVMHCDSKLIHSMQDDGAELPLITLHMYTKSIDHMIVYDRANDETLVVEGSFGAWIPHDHPQMIRERRPGMQRIEHTE